MHSSRLTVIPNWLGELSCLKTLDLGGGDGSGVNNNNLKELPADLGKLWSLETLALRNLSGLEKLPDTVCSLTALKSLTIDNCRKITELPADIGNLRALCTLELRNSSVKELPPSIGSLGLQTLELYTCDQLKKLPDTVGRLYSLENLTVAHCCGITELPASIGGLRTLHTFVLEGTPLIKKLPDPVGRLTALVNLAIERCSALTELPSPLGRVVALRKLELLNVGKLDKLPHSIFHGFGELVELTISGSHSLQRLPDTLDRLTFLEKLAIAECEQFKNLPTSISNLIRLKILLIRECPLRDMPCIEALTELHRLELVVSDYASGSEAFKALSRSLPCLKQLETLCLGRDASEDAFDELHYDLEFADDYGDQALSEEDVLAIGRALKAWPLPLLNRVSGNHGADVDFGICRQELGLPTSFDQFWHITPTNYIGGCTSLAFFRKQQKKVEAFASGM